MIEYGRPRRVVDDGTFSTAQAAEILGVTRRRVQALIKSRRATERKRGGVKMDARIHYLSWKETWYVFENDNPRGIDVVYLSGVPEGTSKDEILRVANNRKAFLFSRLHLVPPAETATHGSLAATAEQSGTVTWEELLNAEEDG